MKIIFKKQKQKIKIENRKYFREQRTPNIAYKFKNFDPQNLQGIGYKERRQFLLNKL